MEEYLEKLLAQIRCKKARPYIAEEIRGHIESQIEDNIVSGMTDQEAEKNAVADMGNDSYIEWAASGRTVRGKEYIGVVKQLIDLRTDPLAGRAP